MASAFSWVRFLDALAAALLLAAPVAAQSRDSAPSLHWFTAPALFPSAAQMALLRGNPYKPGLFTALLSMPDGYRMPPHFHPTDEHIEVKQGIFLVGIGDRMDLKKVQSLSAGDTATAPAGMHHYAATRGATIISVSAVGPYVMTYIRVQDEPWHTFPFNY
jgi:quercetin dioxygenase-like cupin family protein